jgi:hypothetical protein
MESACPLLHSIDSSEFHMNMALPNVYEFIKKKEKKKDWWIH